MTRRVFLALLLMLMMGAPAAHADEVILRNYNGVSFGYDIYRYGSGYRVKLFIHNRNYRRIATNGRFGIDFRNGNTAWMDATTVGARNERYYVSTVYYRYYPQYRSWHSPSWRTL